MATSIFRIVQFISLKVMTNEKKGKCEGSKDMYSINKRMVYSRGMYTYSPNYPIPTLGEPPNPRVGTHTGTHYPEDNFFFIGGFLGFLFTVFNTV